MGLQSPEEERGNEKFQILDYDSGFFEPSGKQIEFPLSKEGLVDWNSFNGRSESKLFGLGQKLLLPDNSIIGQRILFGREAGIVDVVIDTDIVGEYAQREQGVSRQHFELSRSENEK